MSLFGDFFGETDNEYRAKVQAQQSAQLLKDTATNNINTGTGLVNNASVGYGNISAQGQNQARINYDQIQAALQGYSNASGTSYTPGANPYGTTITPAMETAAKSGGGGDRTPRPLGTAAQPTATPTASAPTQNPYSLSQAQQETLNQSIDKNNAARQTAIAHYTASTSNPLPQMIQYIHQYYDQQNNELNTQAGTAANQQRLTGYKQLLDTAGGLQQQGVSSQQFGTSGTAGLGTNVLAQGGQGISQYASNSNQAYQNQQQQDSFGASGLGSLVGFGLSYLMPGANSILGAAKKVVPNIDSIPTSDYYGSGPA